MLRSVIKRTSSPFLRPFLSSNRFLFTASSSQKWGNTIRPAHYAQLRPTLIPRPPFSPSGSSAQFRTTTKVQYSPFFPVFIALLKTSTSLQFAQTASRVLLTFMPAILWKNYKTRWHIKHAALHGIPTREEESVLLKRIKNRTRILKLLVLLPFALFWATIIATLERTPLTGRWRMIVLSPEEEEAISAQLAGPGWYQAVHDILTHEGAPTYLSVSDWRYQWVNETLRKLEASIPVLASEPEIPSSLEDDIPFPPPAKYPLRPRLRASEYLHWMSISICDGKIHPIPQYIPGPPYSLVVVDKAEASNAFSYGFGPDGGGGIVVYSGFLDDILTNLPSEYQNPPTTQKTWAGFLSGLFFSKPEPPRHPTPTAEQTTELAVLLAHELSHLILSHHLESISSDTVIIPGTLSIIADVIRVLIFPVTMLFGPFVNDAVGQLGKVGSSELLKLGEYCTSFKQEKEADIVSARLLAHSGFDARDAVRFWERRIGTGIDCGTDDINLNPNGPVALARGITGAGHPRSEARVESLKYELARWASEKQAVISRISAQGSS